MKKTALAEYDTNRSGGIIAINLREDDELIQALLVEDSSDLLLVSRKGMSIRFTASDDSLRPMGRSTSGVIGMHFRGEDQLLAARVVSDEGFVFVVTEGGFAKRTAVDQYRLQQRGGLGIKVAKLQEARGDLAGALIVGESDEVLVVLESGKVVRSNVSKFRRRGATRWVWSSLASPRVTESSRLPGTATPPWRRLQMSSVKSPSRPTETAQKDSVADKLSDRTPRPAQSKQVRLKLVYIDFWSAVKFSFLIAAAVGVIIFVAVLLIWTVLASTGVFDQVSKLMQDVSGQSSLTVSNVISFAQVMGFTLVIAALNVVVGTVLGAIACVLYNLSVRITADPGRLQERLRADTLFCGSQHRFGAAAGAR